ncbi:MAG: aldehyde dehydrogenase family protein [Acidimicrobiia bacterium]
MTSTLDPTTRHAGAPPAAATVARLRATFASGRTRPVGYRKDQLRALDRLLVEREADLLEALRLDLGKPAIEGYLTDIAFVRAEIAETIKHLDAWLRPEKAAVPLKQQPGRARIHHDPLGTVLVIGPWNYPVQLVLAPLVGAIAGGNTVAIKPSEVAAHTSRALARLVPEFLDTDAYAVVEGGVPETTALLAERWDHIFYTGNGTVGRVVMRAAAEHLTPVTLELGGKSPVIVDASANLDVAARRIVWGKYLNAGQTCIAPDYVLVDRRVEGPLLARMRDAVRDFYGSDPRSSADLGRIVNDRHFERITRLADAGGTGEVVYGGERDAASRYIAPTAYRGTDATAAIMQEEIFGPLLPTLPVDDLDDAIDFVTARDKPLALYLFAEDTAAQEHVLGHTSSGGVCLNATLFHITVPGLPFGGVGESGMGAYHGRASFATFTHRKSVLSRPTKLDPSIAYPPYSNLKARLLRRLL